MDSRTSPEALKENHPRNGKSRQSEEKESGRARDGQGESAQCGRRPESITHNRAGAQAQSALCQSARGGGGGGGETDPSS